MKEKIKMILFFILFMFHSICVNIVHPVTTDYVSSLNLPTYYFGFFFSLMSLGQVIGAILFGNLSDKIGRKWLIVIGILGYGLSQAGFGFVNSYPLLILVFRVLAGIFVSAPNTLFISMCVDKSNPNKKIRNLSVLNACQILGASLGYEIGGSLFNYASFSISQVFLFQISCCLVVSIIFAIFIKDEARNVSISKKVDFKSLLGLDKLIYIFLGSLLVLTVGQILISKYLDTFIIHIGYNAATLGHYVLISGIIGAISNILLIPIIKKLNGKHIMYCLLSFILLSGIITIITFSVNVDYIMYMLFSTHLFYMSLKSLITPLEQNELTKNSTIDNNGKIMGARQTMLSIGNVIGPLLGSAIYTNGSPFVFIVSACIIIFSFVLFGSYYILKGKQKDESVSIRK